MKRLGSLLIVTNLAAAMLVFLAAPAAAVCHAVSISASPPRVEEKETEVTVTIHRQIIAPGCTANINYTTSDDSATQPSDYTKKTGHCTEFDGEANRLAPDCTFKVPIKDDASYEGNETFMVSFSGTSNEPVAGSATVTIQDNDAASPTASPTSPPKSSPKTSPTTTSTASPASSPTVTQQGTASPGAPLPLSPGASPTESPEVTAQEEGDDDGGAPTGLIVAAIAIVLAAGAGVGLWFLRKTPG